MYFNAPMPDCVPEYYRSRQDGADHRDELQMRRQTHYLANRQKLDAAVAAGLPVLTLTDYCQCWDCRTAGHDTMTGDDDDFDRVICRDPACPHHRKEESQ